jgi:hypothetical protein
VLADADLRLIERRELLANSSEWIRTTDLTIMSRAPPLNGGVSVGTRDREIPANAETHHSSRDRTPRRACTFVHPGRPCATYAKHELTACFVEP